MIVGTDVSSTWPDSATKLPQVGYQRTLSAENVLSLSPTLIIASEEAGPPAAIEQLRNSGVRVVIVSSEHSAEGARTKILEVAKAVGRESEGEALARRMDEDMQAVLPAHNQKQPSVMFIYTRGAGALQVSGSNTAANAMIELAGARNAIEGYEGYKPLTPEAGIAAAPDVILIPEHGLQQLGGVEALLNTPGIAETPAGKYRRVIAMDDLYLLGFGPRFGKARQELAQRIYDAIAGADNASSL
jgi:iron complex transport system substrate-binding protein